jgi:hypothetical protein
LIVAAIAAEKNILLAIVPLAIALGSAIVSAMHAKIEPRYDDRRGRATVAALIYLGPLLRSYERYRWRIKGLTDVERIRFAKPTQSPHVRWFAREFRLRYWSDRSQEKEELLEGVIRFLLPRKYLIAHDLGWSGWDVEIHRGIWAKSQVRVAVENHGGSKRLFNVRCTVKTSRAGKLAIGGLAALLGLGAYFLVPELLAVATVLGVLAGISVGYQSFIVGRVMHHVLEIVAQQIGLTPVESRT